MSRPLSTIEEHSHEEESSLDETVHSSERKHKGNSHGRWVAVYYLLVVVAIGVPVWLKTTSPLRHSLPDISNLVVHSQMMFHQVPISIIDVRQQSSKPVDQLIKLLQNQRAASVSPDGSISFQFHWSIQQPDERLRKVFSQAKSLVEVDQQLFSDYFSIHYSGRLIIFIADQHLFSGQKFLLGSSRTIYVSGSVDQDSLLDYIGNIVADVVSPSVGFSQDGGLSSLLNPQLNFFVNVIFEDASDRPMFVSSGRLDTIRSLSIEGLELNSGIDQLLNLQVTSQMVYYAIDKESVADMVNYATDGKRILPTRNLPILVNHIESRIDETDTKTSFQVNIIIPTANLSLHFANEKSDISHVMLSASRGAFIVWNDGDDLNIALKSVIRRAFGFPQNMPRESVRKDLFFHLWELDSLKRYRSQKQVLASLSSLESVEKLLVKVSNIVIKDDVAHQMHQSVDMSHKAINLLSQGKLEEAYQYSCHAYQLAENAFYDPSLLALLYFPDDQKYAVYFPLFLPVSLPMVLTLFHFAKSFIRERRKKHQAQTPATHD